MRVHYNFIHKEQQPDKLNWVSITFGIILPLVIYLAVGIMSLMYNYIQICSCYTTKKGYARCKFDLKCRHCPQGSEWINIIIKVSTIIGSVLYFLGDNFRELYKGSNAGAISLGFSVFGVLLFRIVPVALRKLERYFKNKPHGEKRVFNWCSPNGNETHSLIVAYTYLLTIAIDFDVWLTVILKKGDNNDKISLCNRMHEVNLLWFLYGGMMALFIGIVVIILTVFVMAYRRPNANRNKLHVLLPSHGGVTKVCIVIWEVILTIVLVAGIGMFLVADNQHLLDCYKVMTDVDQDESLLRLVFFLVALIIFSMITIGFFCRTLCCCVRVKGEILSVDVLQNDQLEVYFKENPITCCTRTKTVIGSLKYDIHTSEIIDSNSSHHELYRNDIERITKCLVGCIGKCVAVNIQEDQIAVVYEMKGKIYIVMHNTSKPSECNVYTEETKSESTNDSNQLPTANPPQQHIDFENDETRPLLRDNPKEMIELNEFTSHTAMYYQDNQRCSVYLKKHGSQQYVVQAKTPRDTLEKYITFNIIADQKVLRVLNDLSDTREGNFIPKENCFEDERLV